jgi:S1-C subfamily serine protease
VTVVHRLSGWKLLTWLAVSGPPALELDRFPSASDVHTNIVAGFLGPDGKTVMARIPRAEVELETLALSPPPLDLFGFNEKPFAPSFPEFMLVSRDGKRVKAKFVGLDSTTGLSLLEAEEPLLSIAAGDEGHTETPSVGQRVHLFAPARVTPPAHYPGVIDQDGTIYLDMSSTAGQLVEVNRAAPGQPARVTAHAPQATPALAGAVATNDSGRPLGIVALSGPAEARILPMEDVRTAADRVRAVRSVVVPQPWLGVRGDAAFKSSLDVWVSRGWKPEAALPLIRGRRGVFVTSVAPETPAFQSGLRSGDVIARVGESEVAGIDDLTTLLRQAGVGAEVNLTVLRAFSSEPVRLPVVLSGSPYPAISTLEAELRAARSDVFDVRSEVSAVRRDQRRLKGGSQEVERQAAELAALEARTRRAEQGLMDALARYAAAEERVAVARARVLRTPDWSITAKGSFLPRPLRSSGLEVIGLTPRSATRLGAKGGVLVVYAMPGSAAARCGLRAGDVIETVDGRSFAHSELRGIIRNSIEPQIALGVVRGPTKLTILLPLDEREKE